MTLDYFYGAQADQFAFYRIPKALFTDERFKSISAEAKILYGILLDRMSLSRKNGWLDEQGRVFIIFTLEEVMEAIGCADQKATKLLNELDSKAGLIERKRQGLGKPNLIFVKNFVDNSTGSISPVQESRIKTRENHDSADVNFTTPESRKWGAASWRFPRSPRRPIRSRTGKHRAWSCNRRPDSMQRKEMMHLAGGG